MLLHLLSSFQCVIFLFGSYAYISIESIDCIHLLSLALNAILSTFSANTLRFSVLDICYDFDINLLFFMNS